ncbi:polysaccharide deacetylase family protein [Roseobacter weihaiensis]|uniref:polysaccharide deacetylase n=1 Tax=Roseobacter weihaiensis TaxID=2763262 RepID=UPI001D0AD852|nr:polysaccharide deacetylase [Roseobacter sp. H9]
MKPDWTPLRHALQEYRRSGLNLPVWWRDDDVTAPSSPLDQLHRLAESLDFPVHLAVIPGVAQETLAELTATSDHMVPLVHGWLHQNNTPAGAKKAEFGLYTKDGADNLTLALTQMRRLFGELFLPVFVPPWNRIDPVYADCLGAAGYRGLSTFTARSAPMAAPGLVQINTHIDPVDWHGTRSLKDPDLLISQTVDVLLARRTGAADPAEPLGYLTHHLIHTAELWDFSHSFLQEMLDGGAAVQPITPLLETGT